MQDLLARPTNLEKNIDLQETPTPIGCRQVFFIASCFPLPKHPPGRHILQSIRDRYQDVA
jgi:hypothetical protein